jgi:3-dehydroquinate dehydratase-2
VRTTGHAISNPPDSPPLSGIQGEGRMAQYKFLIMNGPNLGHLGQREPDMYGLQSMEDLPPLIHELMDKRAECFTLDFFQANGEGELIDRLEEAWHDKIDGLVLNAGAFTHTSLALADCLAWIKIPCVEVHLTNVLARPEPIRHQSYIAKQVIGVIAGFGLLSYALGIEALLYYLQEGANPC